MTKCCAHPDDLGDWCPLHEAQYTAEGWQRIATKVKEERDQLRERVAQLEADCDRMQVAAGLIYHLPPDLRRFWNSALIELAKEKNEKIESLERWSQECEEGWGRMSAALRKYGQHLPGCKRFKEDWAYDTGECQCGLDALLDGDIPSRTDVPCETCGAAIGVPCTCANLSHE